MPTYAPAASLQKTVPVKPGLGPRLELFTSRRLAWRDLFLLFLPGILSVGAPLAYGLYIYGFAYTHFGPTAADSWSAPWLALSALAGAVFLCLGLYRLAIARPFAALHQNGLRLRPGLGRTYTFLWSELSGVSTELGQEVFLGLPIRQTFSATLYPNVGRPVRLSSGVRRLPDLVSQIKANLYPRLTPGLQTNFQARRWLYFGPLAVHCQGLARLEKKRRLARRRTNPPVIPWEQVERVSVQDGFLVIAFRPAGSPENASPRTPLRLPVASIPNLEILLQIIKQGVPS